MSHGDNALCTRREALCLAVSAPYADYTHPVNTILWEHSDSPVPIAYVNKASDEELETITNDYIQNGGDIFTDIDPIMIDALGIGEAIGTDEVQNQRIQVEETQKNEQTTDDVAASQGLKTGGGSVA